MWTTLTLSVLIFASVFGALRVRRKRRANARRDSFEASYERLGFEPPELKEGHTMRSKGTFQGHDTIIDIATLDNDASLAARIHTHIKLPQTFPAELSFEAQRVLKPYSGGAGQLLHVIHPDDSTLSLTFHQRSWEGSVRALISNFSPGFIGWLEDLIERYGPEPLTTLQLKDGWLTLGRVITQSAWNSRNLSPGPALENYVGGLVAQHVQCATEHWRFPAHFYQEPQRFWLEGFLYSEDFEDWRSQALGNVLHGYPDSRAGKEAWEYTIQRGNMYDLIYVFNNFTQRALADIPESRLIEFVNAILTRGGNSTENISKLVSTRFEFDILLNRNVHWDLRKTLMRLWMSSVQASNLNAVLMRLPGFVQYQELMEVLAILQELPYIGATNMLASIAKNEPTPTEELLGETTKAFVALSTTHAEALRMDPNVEDALLHVVGLGKPKVSSLAFTALREVGGVRALHELKGIVDAAGFGLSSTPREAKRAHEEILERLKRDPKSGGMTLSVDDEGRGGLSVAKPMGGLELSDPSDPHA